jgi:hypothetical protein
VARLLAADADVIASEVDRAGDDASTARVLREVGASFVNFSVVAQREAEQRVALSRRADVVASVPQLSHDVADLSVLLEMGRSLWAPDS